MIFCTKLFLVNEKAKIYLFSILVLLSSRMNIIRINGTELEFDVCRLQCFSTRIPQLRETENNYGTGLAILSATDGIRYLLGANNKILLLSTPFLGNQRTYTWIS